MNNPFITMNDKQILIDWYLREIAGSCGKDAQISMATGETWQPEIDGPLVEKRLDTGDQKW